MAATDLILGTAGHIDHGKSALIRALTGTDPDRLKEEKERGITIELGFAQLILPDGCTMGVVDVPGHERFVRQMIAGATGIDVALLVIAADDGIMPQTREHVTVLETLGIATCVVALTKIDLVDAEWTQLIEGEVRSWLATTPYKDAAICPVSSKSGEGLDKLKQALVDACGKTTRIKDSSFTRMPIDRVFTIKGAGTVVTGTLWGGTVSKGDELEVVGKDLIGRVRGVQEHGQELESAQAGNRVAINFANLSTTQIEPGDFLAAPGSVQASDRFDARIDYVDTSMSGRPLKTGQRMHIAHGTREVLGRVLFSDDKKTLAAGQSCLAQVRLEEPLALSAADRFIMRTYSPVLVAGGGTVLLAHPKRRTHLSDEEKELFDAVEDRDDKAVVKRAVATHRRPISAAEIARLVGMQTGYVEELLVEEPGPIVSLQAAKSRPRLFATKAYCNKMASKIERELIEFAGEHPNDVGLQKDVVLSRCCPGLEEWRFEALLKWVVDEGKAILADDKVGHPGSQDAVRAAQEEATDALEAHMREVGISSPPLKYLLADSGLPEDRALRALRILEGAGRAVKIADDYWLDASTLEGAAQTVKSFIEENGPASASQLKDALGTSRRYAMPLLEYLDAHGHTVRDGDTRNVR